MESDPTAGTDGLFSYDQPLGPPAIIPELHLSSLSSIYLSELRPYDADLPPERATYLMGRRGAGKTTLLVAGAGFNPEQNIRLFESDLLTGMLDLVQSIERDVHFTLSLENRIELWKATFSVAAAAHLVHKINSPAYVPERLELHHYLSCLRTESGLQLHTPTDYVRAFEEYVLREARMSIRGPLHAWLNSLTLGNVSVGTVRNNTETIVAGETRHLTILIDSLEELLNRPTHYKDILKPLFALLGRQAMSGTNRPGLYIRCCLPTELYDHLADLSDNPTKDFRGACNIQWSTSDLIYLVAARYKMFADTLANDGYPSLRSALNTLPREPRDLLNSILPKTVKNSCGFDELTLPYLLRHTQLLPRQILILFNLLLRGAETTQCVIENRRLDPTATLEAVTTAEHELALEVVNAFKGYWNSIDPALSTLVPRLPPTFSFDDLHSLFEELGLRRYTEDTTQLLTRLVKVGVVGRVREVNQYVVGEFSYVYPHGMSAVGAPELCLHPMFSRYSGRSRTNHTPIYPAPSPETAAPLYA